MRRREKFFQKLPSKEKARYRWSGLLPKYRTMVVLLAYLRWKGDKQAERALRRMFRRKRPAWWLENEKKPKYVSVALEMFLDGNQINKDYSKVKPWKKN